MCDLSSRNSVSSTGFFFEQVYYQSPPSFVPEASAPAPTSASYFQPVPAIPFPASSAGQNLHVTVDTQKETNSPHLQSPVSSPRSGVSLDLDVMIQAPLVSHIDTPDLSGNFAIDGNPVRLGGALQSQSLPVSDTASDPTSDWCRWIADLLQVNTNGDE